MEDLKVLEKNKEELKKFYEEKAEIKNIKEENLKKIEHLLTFDYLQKDEEKELYEKFCEIANADPDEKFKFEHIEKLGVPADVVVVYGKKSIGKTYQINKIIWELAENDPLGQVILLRNTVSEFKALRRQLTVKESCISLKGSNNNPSLFHKYLTSWDDKPRYMGFCAALNGSALEAAKGAEYPHIRLIIWDECTNVGAGNSYNSSDIYRFVTFFDSIIRNKKNVKIYIFGNFHRNTDGKVSDVLLDTLKIPYGCTLKTREVLSSDGKNKSTFLYINTGSLYSGVDNNSKVALFSDEIQEDLYSNMPQSHSDMVGSLNLFYSHKPEYGLVFNDGTETYILLISSYIEKKNKEQLEINWMIHMEKFPSNNAFVHDLLTSDIGLYNEYRSHDLQLIMEQEERLYIHDLYEMCLQRSLYYTGDISRELFRIQMSKWQTKYNLGISASFWKTKRVKAEGY